MSPIILGCRHSLLLHSAPTQYSVSKPTLHARSLVTFERLPHSQLIAHVVLDRLYINGACQGCPVLWHAKYFTPALAVSIVMPPNGFSFQTVCKTISRINNLAHLTSHTRYQSLEAIGQHTCILIYSTWASCQPAFVWKCTQSYRFRCWHDELSKLRSQPPQQTERVVCGSFEDPQPKEGRRVRKDRKITAENSIGVTAALKSCNLAAQAGNRMCCPGKTKGAEC